MGSPAMPPPGQQQDPTQLQAPSIKRSLLSLIPIAGPALYAHSLIDLQMKRRAQDQQIAANHQLFTLAQANANDQQLSPDLQMPWKQLTADMAIEAEKNPAKTFSPALLKRHQDLLSQTTQQKAIQQMNGAAATPPSLQAQSPGPAAPPAQLGTPGMLPQGSGPAKVPDSAQGPAVLPPPPQAGPSPAPQSSADPNDPLAPLMQQANDPNPWIAGPARNALRAVQVSQSQLALRLSNLTKQLQMAGKNPADLPVEAWMDLIGKGEIRPLTPLKPGEVQPSIGGGIVAQNPLPRLESVAPGSQLVSVPTPGATGNAGLTPPPGGSGATVLAQPPGKVAEGDVIPDPNAKKTGWARILRDEVTGKERGRVLDVAPPSGMVPEETFGQQQVTDAAGNIHQVPTHTVRRPLLNGTPSLTPPPSATSAPGSAPQGGSPGPVIGARPMAPAQREQLDARSQALDNTTQLFTSVLQRLPILNSLISAGKIQLASSPSAGAQVVSRATDLTPDEAQLAADMGSLAEHINTLRGPLGATGFRGHEAFGALQQQRGMLLGNPEVSKRIMLNSLRALLGQRVAAQKELAKVQGLAKPKLDSETAKAYLMLTDGDKQKAIQLATSQGYDVSR